MGAKLAASLADLVAIEVSVQGLSFVLRLAVRCLRSAGVEEEEEEEEVILAGR